MLRPGGRRPWRFLFLASLVLVGIGVGFSFARSRRTVALERGTAAYERGEWDRAATLANEGLRWSPGDTEALRLAARAAARLGRDADARSLYARLGGPAVMAPEDLYLLGSAHERAGDSLSALECWQQGLQRDAGCPEILAGFARHSLRARQLAEAARFARELAGRPGWEARGDLLLGVAESERGDLARAAEALGRGLARDPAASGASDPPATYYRLLARALMRTGKPAEAIPALKAVLASGPEPEASWLLSRAHLQTGRIAEATAALEAAGTYRDAHETTPELTPAVGAARCAECHPAVYKAQQGSLHARTFLSGRGLDDLPLPATPIIDPSVRGVRHEITRADGKVRFDTKREEETRRAIVEFAFGSGHHGVTLVGTDEQGGARELRLSYYADGPAWDVTAGQLATPSRGDEILGRPLGEDGVHSCLACHTTDPRSAREGTGPVAADRGIGCERCHGPGEAHLKAIAAKFRDPAIARPRLATAAQVVALCAGCHSPPDREASRTSPFAVRFPGSGLTWSRCYTESGGTLSCITCHDPHRDAETQPVFYEAKCLSCHAATKPSAAAPSSAERTKGRACPVNPRQDCLSCHMPKVGTPIPHTLFTDHFIRVRSATDPPAAAKPLRPDR